MPSNFSQSDRRAENRCLKAERSRPGPHAVARRKQGRGILAFAQADGKGIVAQRPQKGGELRGDQA
jgi:hypothetical protein